MTNYLAELFELTEDIPPLKLPVALLIGIVIILPIMLFVGLIELMDWMLQWTWKGVRKAGGLIFTSGVTAFGLYIFFEALLHGELLGILAGLGCFSVWTWTLIRDLIEWRAH